MAWTYKPISERAALWTLLGLGLLTRLPLLHWFNAETTDGVMCLTYFQLHWYEVPRFVIFPGYPALLRLGEVFFHNGETWGRLLAAIFGTATVWPLWRMVRRFATVETTFLACVAFLLSPLSWMWSLKVMPDAMFLFLLWAALERFQTAWDLPRDGRAIAWGCLFSYAALLTRPEGVFLVLVATALLWKSGRRAWACAFAVSPALLWTLPGTGPIARHVFDAFREGTAGVSDPASHLLEGFWVYTTQPLWVYSPLLALLAIGGFFHILTTGDETGKYWRRLVLPVLAILVFLKMIPTNYQDRHLLPFLPAVCALFALQLEKSWGVWKGRHGEHGALWRRNLLSTVVLSYLVVFAAGVLILQRDSFGDLKRNAEYLRALPTDARVFSDEMIKTTHWSKRPLEPWDPSMHILRVGDYLVFHSFYTPRLSRLEQTMNENHELELVRSDGGYVVPLLTDLMEDPSLQNRPRAVSYRFEPQVFQTRVFRVLKPYANPKFNGKDVKK